MSLPGDRDIARRQQLYNNETLSDITICFSDIRIRAHKAILSMSSDYFFNAFSGNFKEATATEMHLYEDLPEAITDLLRFLYGFNISEDDCTTFHLIDLLTVADKYGVESLYAAAKIDLAGSLERLALPWADFYPDLLQDIYATPACDEETRKSAVTVGQRDLIGWMQQEDFRKLLLEKPEIGVDMLTAVATEEEVANEKKVKVESEALEARAGAESFGGPAVWPRAVRYPGVRFAGD